MEALTTERLNQIEKQARYYAELYKGVTLGDGPPTPDECLSMVEEIRLARACADKIMSDAEAMKTISDNAVATRQRELCKSDASFLKFVADKKKAKKPIKITRKPAKKKTSASWTARHRK